MTACTGRKGDAERRRIAVLRHLASHGPSGVMELVSATGGEIAAPSAVKGMDAFLRKMRSAGLVQLLDGIWRIRDEHKVCSCGCGVVRT